MKEQQDSDYSFLQEKIKERPINRKKLFRNMITTATFAVVFGFVACFVFILLEPVISSWIDPTLNQPEENIVVLPTEEEEKLLEDMVQDEEELLENQQTTTGQLSSTVSDRELQVTDYQMLYDRLGEVAREAEKSVVKVTGVSSGTNWFHNTTERENETSGLIITDNTTELLILTYYDVIKDATEIVVTFCNDEQAVATIKKDDKNTGLAVIAIDLKVISEETKKEIAYATLGSSNSGNLVGDLVIALGGPMGYTESRCYGMVTSAAARISLVDMNYRLLTTDIYGSKNAFGILVNTRGQVIGIISQKYNTSDLQNQVSAIGITELKKVVENLSNKKDTTMLGVYVTDVTEEAKTHLGVPDGAYVTDVKINSPAMLTGISRGDVITAVEDAVVTSVSEYITELRKHHPGQVVTITLMRSSVDGYKEMDVKVTLEALE